MKQITLLLLVCAVLFSIAGCYTPPGGSSIPWNEPAPNEGSFTPRVNF